MIGKGFIGYEEERMVKNVYIKQSGITFLRIINHLFEGGELPSDNHKKHGRYYSNLRILYSLYLMCMAKPKGLTGTSIINEDSSLYACLKSNCLDSYTQEMIFETLSHTNLDVNKPIFMEDDHDIIYPIVLKDILEQIARRQLDRALDQLVASVNSDEINL